MSNVQYTTIGTDGQEFLSVFSPSYSRPQTIHSSHPNFTKVKAEVEQGITPIESDLDPAELVRGKFEALSERVTVKGGRVYLDGDVIDNSLTKAIVRWMEEGISDYQPLVNFFEKVQTNPSENSREQLYNFLAANDYTIDSDGNIVGYKTVRELGDGRFESIRGGRSGDVQVNGEDAASKPVQSVGDEVTMARSTVNPDELIHCSVGLHVAAWDYANCWFGGCSSPVLRVVVNPRDVVSVPTDHSAQKMRVCRYTIDAVIDQPDERVLFTRLGEVVPEGEEAQLDQNYDDEAVCDVCGHEY